MKNETELSTARRARLASTLVSLLDEVLDATAPPEGIAAEIIEALETFDTGTGAEAADWYGVQAALTTLTQETRLQSRAFAKLSDRLAASPGEEMTPLLAGIDEKLGALLTSKTGAETTDGLSCKTIDLLVEVRDRLISAAAAARQSLAAAEQTVPGWWPARILVRKSAEALFDGYRALIAGYTIAVERLDDTLADAGVFETVREGAVFDPATMRIVDIEETDTEPEGTVLSVYRRGYRRDTEVVRTAEVKVARRRSASRPER